MKHNLKIQHTTKHLKNVNTSYWRVFDIKMLVKNVN